MYIFKNYTLITKFDLLPYEYKFLQDFIFMVFTNQRAFAKMKTQNFVCIQYKFAAAGRHS